MTDEASTIDAPVEKSVQVFLGGPPRSKRIDLIAPFSLDGKIYDHVMVKRMRTGEVADFLASLSDQIDVRAVRFPMFEDADGKLLPEAVLDLLDDDDSLALEVAAADFLPRRFRAVNSASTPPSGDGSPAA